MFLVYDIVCSYFILHKNFEKAGMIMLAKKPPMGWNTWNTFGTNINEQLIKESADIFIGSGLKDAGYEYLVIDDCWSERNRDPVTNKIVPDKTKFSNGMKAVSDYVHSRGLKFGMYSCAGVRTCADYPGSFDHEFLDARTFAEYGCDFLKYDFCFKPAKADGSLLYHKMGLALKACGREILFSACNWGRDDIHSWIRSTGAHMYRSTGDINDSFESFKNIFMSQKDKLCYSAPGCYNDMDMLTVGMYGKGLVGSKGCNDADYRSQFALWCLSSAPLMLGCDIRSMSKETLRLVTNKGLLRIDQDEESRPPVVLNVDWNTDHEILFKHLSGGEYAFGFFNLSEAEATMRLFLYNVGLPVSSGYGFELTDVFTGEKIGPFSEYISVNIKEPHDCRVYLARLVKL